MARLYRLASADASKARTTATCHQLPVRTPCWFDGLRPVPARVAGFEDKPFDG